MANSPSPSGDQIILTPLPIDVAAALGEIGNPLAGGINVFVGTARQEKSASGHELAALNYEAYTAMAHGMLGTILAEARDRWPIVRAIVIHRTGRVSLGDPSVLVAVCCPHRGEAFDACRYVIDQLKARVPIWKQSVWSDGSTSWPEPT